MVFTTSEGDNSIQELFSRVFLLRQLWIVNYYVKGSPDYLSNENMKTYTSKIAHFGILIHVLS